MKFSEKCSFGACRLGIVGLMASGLMACASPPSEQVAANDPAPGTTAAPTANAAANTTPSQDRRTSVKQALSEAGLNVSDTPEGLVKASIPSDAAFGLGRTTIGPAFGKLLDKVAAVLGQFPETTLEIVGHTDTSGSDALNLVISRKRAESARHHLVTQGVAATRITSQGWGADQPMADNNTAAGRAANRRVELFVRLP